MNSLVLLLFLIGVILITIGYTKSNLKCPPSKIQYRFIPRSFYEEQLSRDNVSSTFQSMFNESSPWYKYNENTQSTINNKNDNFFTVDD